MNPLIAEAPKGWHPLLEDLLAKLREIPGWNDDLIMQVKEKFGGLRFYWAAPDDWETSGFYERVTTLVNEAEKRSYKICEVCGTEENVKLRSYGWIVTQCTTHALENLEQRYKGLRELYEQQREKAFAEHAKVVAERDALKAASIGTDHAEMERLKAELDALKALLAKVKP